MKKVLPVFFSFLPLLCNKKAKAVPRNFPRKAVGSSFSAKTPSPAGLGVFARMASIVLEK